MSVEAAPGWRTPQGRSAICLDLGPAEAVAIPRAYVHWVVTEYGTAYLFGRPLPERAVALADSAHPDARKSLLDAAIDRGLVGKKQRLRRTSDSSAKQELFRRPPEGDVESRFRQDVCRDRVGKGAVSGTHARAVTGNREPTAGWWWAGSRCL